MIDFEIPSDLAAQRDEIRAFVAETDRPAFSNDPRPTRGPNRSCAPNWWPWPARPGLLTFRPTALRSGSPHWVKAVLTRRRAGRRCSVRWR